MSNLKKRLARVTLPLRSGLTRKGLARATQTFKTGGRISEIDQYDVLTRRLDRLEQGWKTHLPGMLDVVSTTLGKARDAEAINDRIEMFREELDHMRNVMDDMVAAFDSAIQSKPSTIPSWLLIQASRHGLRLRLGRSNESSQSWIELKDIVGSPPVFVLSEDRILGVERGHLDRLYVGADVVASWSTTKLLETLKQVAPLLAADGVIEISADEDAQRRMTLEQTETNAVRLIPDTEDRLLVRAASPV